MTDMQETLGLKRLIFSIATHAFALLLAIIVLASLAFPLMM